MKKWILITGATSGIGLETAKQLAGEGHKVILTGRNLQKLSELENQLLYPKIYFTQLDVTNSDHIEQCKTFIENVTNGYGLDILINNAGYPQTGFLLDLTMEQIRNQYETNIFGLLNITLQLFPLLKRNRGGIINIGSVQGKLYVPFYSIYSSTKHSLRALSHLMRLEFNQLKVKVTLLEPGTTNTNFRDVSVKGIQDVKESSQYYVDLYQKYEKNDFRPLKSMPGISSKKVSNKISKLINKKRWKPSYAISIYGRIYLFAQKITPHWFGEWLTRRIFSL